MIGGDDNWKGEHLIRAPKKVKTFGVQLRKEAAWSTVCAYPACGVRLYKTNTIGVCRKHTHKEGFCLCAKCTQKITPYQNQNPESSP